MYSLGAIADFFVLIGFFPSESNNEVLTFNNDRFIYKWRKHPKSGFIGKEIITQLLNDITMNQH